jgi:hypothetical protein
MAALNMHYIPIKDFLICFDILLSSREERTDGAVCLQYPFTFDQVMQNQNYLDNLTIAAKELKGPPVACSRSLMAFGVFSRFNNMLDINLCDKKSTAQASLCVISLKENEFEHEPDMRIIVSE